MELSTQTWREIFIIIIFPLAYFEAASSPYKGIWLNHLVGLMHQALLENLYRRLRVVSRFSSGIVERAKRERA